MSPDSINRTIVLAAGGTGGHIFPAEALATELAERSYKPVLITDKRFAKYAQALQVVQNGKLEVQTIRAGSLAGNPLRKAMGLTNLQLGVLQARRRLRKLKPLAVVGFGGYPSFPTMLAAVSQRRHTILHEQNAILGRTNRLLGRWVKQIATSFPGTEGLDHIQLAKSIHTGNPVRAAIRALREVPYPDIQADGPLHLLVTGGSQGATVFGEVVPEALEGLPAHLRSRIRIDQQCRPDDVDAVRVRYHNMGVHAEVATFFADIPARLASAHLVIARAGASTVSELLVAGCPAILVPYPHATDDHQTANAGALQEAGGGWVMPQPAFTPETLRDKIRKLMEAPEQLQKASTQMRARAKTDATTRLADLVEAAAKIA